MLSGGKIVYFWMFPLDRSYIMQSILSYIELIPNNIFENNKTPVVNIIRCIHFSFLDRLNMCVHMYLTGQTQVLYDTNVTWNNLIITLNFT